MLEIIPGILEKDWEAIEKKLEIVRPFAKTIHIDIADGKLVPNTTFLDPTPFKKYSNDFFFELHMMVEEPINYLKPFAEAGFRRFLGHIEKMSDQTEFVAQGQMLGEVGLAVDGKTSIGAVKVPFDDLDCMLIMTINAGFSGQKFMVENMSKVKQLKEEILRKAQDDRVKIEVDGGINDKTILLAKEAGATRFVATSFIFGSEDSKGQYDLLLNACNF